MLSTLPRTVWTLAVVSLLNDAASEMIAPLLPIFLTAALGAGPAIVALIEGIADATSSIVKLLAGRAADRGVSGRMLILGGYGLANLARPLIGLAASWTAVLALRFVDRIGKGLRSAPRDALLSASVSADVRGRAFGLHRAFDHAGAMLGPLIAAALLAAQVPMRTVFMLAAGFGVAVMAVLVIGLPSTAPAASKVSAPLTWGSLDRRARGLLVAVAVLAAATLPEAMIVLWATQQGLAAVWVPVLWAAAHAVKAATAWGCGVWVDRIGPQRVLAFGWPARVAALAILAWVPPAGAVIWIAFVHYAATLAATESAERTLLAASVPLERRGTAYGWFHLLTGLAALPGALLFGSLWQNQGSRVALTAAAILAGLACVAAAMISRGVATRAP